MRRVPTSIFSTRARTREGQMMHRIWRLERRRTAGTGGAGSRRTSKSGWRNGGPRRTAGGGSHLHPHPILGGMGGQNWMWMEMREKKPLTCWRRVGRILPNRFILCSRRGRKTGAVGAAGVWQRGLLSVRSILDWKTVVWQRGLLSVRSIPDFFAEAVWCRFLRGGRLLCSGGSQLLWRERWRTRRPLPAAPRRRGRIVAGSGR